MKLYRERQGQGKKPEYPYYAPQNYHHDNIPLVVNQPQQQNYNFANESKGFDGWCYMWTALTVVFMAIIVFLLVNSSHRLG